jgi:hypothetical protein
LGNLVPQNKAALFQAAQGQVIIRQTAGRLVDERIEVSVFHAELDQSALGRMQVVIHESANESKEAKRL